MFKAANYWMGLTDEMIEGRLTWIDTDLEPEFTDWLSGQPDDKGDHEDCVHFWHDYDYLWNDALCSSLLEAICELQ